MKIVLAYSGGLDTSVLLSWIREKYSAEVIAFCADVGQEEETKGLRPKARKTGASDIYIDDLREEFATEFIYPMMQAGAIYEGQYFLGTSIARPLIAKRMVEIARKHPRVSRLITAILERPSVKETSLSDEKIVEGMTRMMKMFASK